MDCDRWAAGVRFLVASALVAWASVAGAGPEPEVFLLAVAEAESFEPGLPTLRYAHDDLSRLVNVMTRTGAVPPGHVMQLRDPSLASVRRAFAALQARLGAVSHRTNTKFLFYYTGHSDATGLHLADGLLRKEELHALLSAVPAEARIAFFDGCYSGALAAKGIMPATDLVVPKAEFDEPSGSVFFAATSGTDVAFELEELHGSLFTHHLVEGLYGAADGNHDGLVTIDELYQYVYKQMGAQAISLPTARSQTPEYRVDLHGRGALVLAYVARTTVPVTLGAGIVGDLTLTSDGGLQVFRMVKTQAAPTRVLLVPGDYAVMLRQGDQVGRGTLSVQAGAERTLALADLTTEKASNLDVVAKGQRPNLRWGVAAGVTSSSYTKPGPTVEASLASQAARIEATEWRVVTLAGGRRNDLTYREQTGTSAALSLVMAVRGSLFPDFRLAGQEWQVLAGGGADYLWQHWRPEAGQQLRTFHDLIPKVVLGIGTTLTLASGNAVGLSFRREFPFAKDAVTGDVLAFGGDVFAASIEW